MELNLFTNIQDTELMVLHALQEFVNVLWGQGAVICIWETSVPQYPLFLTLFNLTCGVAFPEHPLKRCYVYYDFLLLALLTFYAL